MYIKFMIIMFTSIRLESSSALVSTSSMTTPPGSVSPTMTSSVATLSKVHSTTTTTKRPLMSLSSGVGGTVSISLLSHQLSVSSVVTKTSESSSCLPSVVGLTTTAINSEVAGDVYMYITSIGSVWDLKICLQ